MKSKILRSGVLVLFLVLIGARCTKEDLDYDPNSIIGKWEWLYSVNGDLVASYAYPEVGQILTIEFRQDGNLILRENGRIYNETVFSISADTISYNNNGENTYIFKISEDTLKLIKFFTLGDLKFYKRIKL